MNPVLEVKKVENGYVIQFSEIYVPYILSVLAMGSTEAEITVEQFSDYIQRTKPVSGKEWIEEKIECHRQSAAIANYITNEICRLQGAQS